MGVIVKKAKRGKKWKPLFFALRGNKRLLYHFENQQAIKPKGIIDLGACLIDLVDDSLFGRPNCFQIVFHGTCTYVLRTLQRSLRWLPVLLPVGGCDSWLGTRDHHPTHKHTHGRGRVRVWLG